MSDDSARPRFCSHCGNAVARDNNFCVSCGQKLGATAEVGGYASPAAGVVLEPSGTSSHATTSGPAGHVAEPAPSADPDAMTGVGSVHFSWPVPDRTVNVSGRKTSLEIVVVAALYAVAALWAFLETWPALKVIPDLLGGFGGSGLGFAFSWLALLALLIVLYLIAGLAFTGFKVFAGDPLGRGLSAVIATVLVLTVLGGNAPAGLGFAALISCAATAVLFLSPWAKRVFATSEARAERPSGIVLSQTLLVVLTSIYVFVTVAMLPSLGSINALNELGSLGGSSSAGTMMVVALVVMAGAAVGSWLAYRRILRRDPVGRIIATAVAGVMALLTLLGGDGSNPLPMIALQASVVVPLWTGRSKAWFVSEPVHAPGAPPSPTA